MGTYLKCSILISILGYYWYVVPNSGVDHNSYQYEWIISLFFFLIELLAKGSVGPSKI